MRLEVEKKKKENLYWEERWPSGRKEPDESGVTEWWMEPKTLMKL